MNRVGVVITCHNEAPYIADAIHSALNQTRMPNRVVVVDDGSTDGSLREIKPWRGICAEGVDLLTITNRGMAAARNAGLMALGECEWVIHLDGDDYLEPNFIEEAQRVRQDAVVTRVMRSDGQEWMPEPVTLASMVERCTLSSCALFRRAALVGIGGFRSDLGGDCDWGAWVELLARGATVGYCPTTAYHYRRRPGSLSTVETKADRARHHALIRKLAEEAS